MFDAKIVEVEAKKVLGIKKIGSYEDVPAMIFSLLKFILENKELEIKGPPIYIVHEKTAAEAKEAQTNGNAELEVCVPITGDLPLTGDFKIYTLPGRKMGRIMHIGSYDKIGNSYQKLYRWLKEQRYQLTGLAREVHVNDPRIVDEGDILTEIQIPVK